MSGWIILGFGHTLQPRTCARSVPPANAEFSTNTFQFHGRAEKFSIGSVTQYINYSPLLLCVQASGTKRDSVDDHVRGDHCDEKWEVAHVLAVEQG